MQGSSRLAKASFSRPVRTAVLAVVLAATSLAAPAHAGDPSAVLHEPIPPDPAEDQVMHARSDGAGHVSSGSHSLIGNGAPGRDAPSQEAHDSPTSPTRSGETAYAGAGPTGFVPDRDTERPGVARYDEPFSPSNAPFKRLAVFDAVDADYTLGLRDPSLVPIEVGTPARDGDQRFSGDIAVDLGPSTRVRIPSVAPDARVISARLTEGGDDLAFRLLRDGADNWFLDADGGAPRGRARLHVDVAVDPRAFGGPLADLPWSSLPPVSPLPANVEHDAAQVRQAIGVSRKMRPREAITRLVDYFRSFVESTHDESARRGEAPADGRDRSIYLDLALARKGVCRHRSFAFLVTAQSLGIPTRMVTNEVHAWVEVHDGSGWRRVDLGGAGDLAWAGSPPSREAAYSPPPDPFRWPPGSVRGADSVATARVNAGGAGESDEGSGGGSASASSSSGSPTRGTAPTAHPADTAHADEASPDPVPHERPASVVELQVVDADPHRGLPLHVRGVVRASGQPCAHAAVDLLLREVATGRTTSIGTVATDEDGAFAGTVVVPSAVAVGDYDVLAHTSGAGACGAGSN